MKKLENNRKIFISTNRQVQRDWVEMQNNLEKEELLTDKNKKQTSEKFITDNRHENVRGKLKKN